MGNPIGRDRIAGGTGKMEAILTWVGSLLLGLASAFGYTRTKIKTIDRDIKTLNGDISILQDDMKECKKVCVSVPTFSQFEQRFEEVVGGVQASVDQLNMSNDMILKELLCIKTKMKNGG